MTCAEGCYICLHDDPNAPEDGCVGCEASWEAYYAAAYPETLGGKAEALRNAITGLFDEIAKALRIDRMVTWLENAKRK